MARILIADEHPVTRYALSHILLEDRHTVVGEATTGSEALGQCIRQAPDLLIIDLDLSQNTGLDVISRLRAKGLTLPILGFSAQDSEHIIGRFLQVGASGFVSKHQDVDVLKEAVAVLLRGHSFFPSNLLGTVHRDSIQEGDKERIKSLSNREISVLSRVAAGCSNHEIANELTISEKSVSTYRARLRAKLNLKSMPDLIDFARRNHLVTSGVGSSWSSSELSDNDSAVIWRSMVESLPAAFYVRDKEARLIYANPAHLEMYHTELDEILGTRTTDVDWYKPSDAQNMLSFLKRAIEEQTSFNKDIQLSIHGRQRVLHHWGTPYRDAEGRLLGMICCSTDITQRYEQVDALRIRAEASEVAHHQLSDLFTSATKTISYQLDELTNVLGEERLSSTRSSELLKQLREQWASLDSILIPAKAEPRRLQSTRLDELAASVLDKLRTKADQKQLWLKLDTDEMTRVLINVDGPSLRDALEYLGRYVIEVTQTEGVRLSVAATRRQGELDVRLTLRGSPRNQADELRVYSLSELTGAAIETSQGGVSLSLDLARQLINRLKRRVSINQFARRGMCRYC